MARAPATRLIGVVSELFPLIHHYRLYRTSHGYRWPNPPAKQLHLSFRFVGRDQSEKVSSFANCRFAVPYGSGPIWPLWKFIPAVARNKHKQQKHPMAWHSRTPAYGRPSNALFRLPSTARFAPKPTKYQRTALPDGRWSARATRNDDEDRPWPYAVPLSMCISS